MARLLIKSDNLQNLMYEVLKKCGLTEQDAEIAAKVLIQADLRGVDTHGAIRLPIYVKRLQLGLVNPRPVIRLSGKRLPRQLSTAISGLVT